MSFILISKLKTVITSCNGIQDSLGFLIPHHGFRIPGTGFYILCQWSLDSSCGCADSLCCILDNFKAQDYVFHGKNFLDSILHKQNFSRFPYMGWQWPKLNHFTIEANLSNEILITVGEVLFLSLNRGTQRQFSEKYLFGRRFEI